MGFFSTEVRVCGSCGNEWEPLAFWDEKIPCFDCSRDEYQRWIDAANSTRDYSIESIGGACPTQAEGQWIDGGRFYFRARHGDWLLRIDPDDAVGGRVIAGGDDPMHGNVPLDDVLAYLDEAARGAFT